LIRLFLARTNTQLPYMKKIVFLLSLLCFGFASVAQSTYWKKSTQNFYNNKVVQTETEPYQIFELDQNTLQRQLSSGKTSQLSMPTSQGIFEDYLVEEKQSMAKELAQKYPAFKTYQGYKISDPKSRIALTLTGDRIYLYAFSEASEGMRMLSTDTYMFYKISGNQSRSEDISCGVPLADPPATADQPTTLGSRLEVTSQTARNKVEGIRTLRLAVVSAGEYGEINGGTQETVLANIVSIVNGLNVISEQDLGIRYNLIENNDKLIFVNKTTDPYDIEQNGISTISSYLNIRTQGVIDSLVGKENYDIGHLFIARNETDSPVPFGIGNAFGIGNVGTPEKGSGWSYFSKSTTDELGFIGLVSHEFGHQLGATHTFSNSPDNQITQSELGSGRSLMSYGKINQPDLHYYHYHSIHQIIQAFKRTQFGLDFSTIGTFTPYSQQPPSNVSLTAYHIPIKTPFVLETPAALKNATYVYNWEQLDAEIVLPRNYWGAKSLKAPLFSSTSPSTNSQRYFPTYARVLSNELTSDNALLDENNGSSMLFETLSEVPRPMTFGLTVRDGSAAQGVYLDSTQVTTVANSKPFSILTPFTSQLNGGNLLNVEWEISNTNDDPIKATQVNILLSTDGGATFDYLLAEKIANDGAQEIVIPNVATTQGRLKIEPIDQIFYTINPTNFTIVDSQLSLFSSATALELTSCNEYKQTFNLQVQSNQATTSLSNISFTGAPAGLTISLSKNQVALNELFTATVSNQTAASGTYTLTLKATLNGATIERPIVLTILSSALSPVTLTSPAPGETITQNTVELKWDLAANTQNVRLQISKDQNFSTLLVDKISYSDQYFFSPPTNQTTYFWRVYAQNACATSEPTSSNFIWNKGFEKQLIHNSSLYDTSNDSYPIQVTDSNTIKEVKLMASVAKDASAGLVKLNDMTMSLTSPSGLSVVLSRPTNTTLVDLSSVSFVFEDQAAQYSPPIFNPSTQTWQLSIVPEESLSQFIGANTLGDWIFKAEGKSTELFIEGVTLEFLSDEPFKAPSAQNLNVYLFQNETKISLLGKNYSGEDLVNSKIIINKLPTNGTLVDSQANLLAVNTAYPITDVYFVPNQGYQGLDSFTYQVLDTDFNLESITAQVTIDYKDLKPALKVFDIYASVQTGKSQTLHLTFKNAEFYNSFTYSLSSPMYGIAEIEGNSILYQATSEGEELIEVTYMDGTNESLSYIHILNFGSYNSIEEPVQVLSRDDFDFRIGRTVTINADGSVLASSQNIQWDEEGAGYGGKNYEGLTKVFSLQDGEYVPLGNEIMGEGINDRLGYRISLSGDGKIIALATNHVEGCMACAEAVDYVLIYSYDEVLKKWVKKGDKIMFEGGSSIVNISSVDLNFDGSILAVGNSRTPRNGKASGAVFTFSFNEITNSWMQKGSVITNTFVGSSEDGADFGDFVRLNKAGNRLVLNQPFSFFNNSKAGHVYALEFDEKDWKLMGQPIIGSQGYWSRFGKTVDMNDLGDQIVISENYEVISSNEIYLGKAYAYTYDEVNNRWNAFGDQIKGPKITTSGSIELWKSTDENAKVSINGAGNQIALSLKIDEQLEVNDRNPFHFINVYTYEKTSNAWTTFSEPFAREVHESVHRPTYNETIISSNGAKVFFGSGEKVGLPEDRTFIKVYETLATTPPDTQAPVLVVKNPYTLQIPDSGTAILEASSLDNGSTDNIGITEITLSKSTFTCADLGTNSITFTAKDAAGNISTATVTINVVDELKPILKAKTSYTIKLDTEGKATLKWEDIDEGSSDNCSIQDRTLSKSEFTRTDGGDSKITYTVTDVSGNTSSIELTVRVDIVLAVPERPKDANFLKAYPNPVDNYLYLEFENGTSVSTIHSSSLVDASGRVLGELNLEDGGNGVLGFSTQSLKPGLYFLQIGTRDTLHLIKFTVIH